MITKNTLKSYSFNDIETYWEMCIESKINGNISQCKEQISQASKKQLKDFIKSEIYGDSKDVEFCKDFALNLL